MNLKMTYDVFEVHDGACFHWASFMLLNEALDYARKSEACRDGRSVVFDNIREAIVPHHLQVVK